MRDAGGQAPRPVVEQPRPAGTRPVDADLVDETFETFAIAGASESALRLIADRATKNEITVVSDVPDDLPALFADERMVKQILINLLTNAVKFTAPGGTVRLSAPADEAGLTLTVSDTGIGIPADKLETVLQPFGQADMSLERDYEGTGLGLPLVTSMTDLHEGRMWISSEVGNGTSVEIWFPATSMVGNPDRMIA